MKPCASVGLLGSLSLVSTLAFSGCGGGAAESPKAETPASGAAATPPEHEDGPAAAAGGGASDAPAGSAAADDAPPSNAGGGDTRTLEVITAIVKSHRKEARECYEKALKQIPGLKGDVVIHFVLKPSGAVKLAELNESRSTIREASVSSCVIDVIHKMEFPRSSKGRESTVNYPFNFNP